jgi:hypothetical protein
MSTVASLALLATLSAAPVAPQAPRLFAPDVVSSAHEEFGAAFTPDGNTVYFNRADPTRFNFQIILVSHFRGGRWTRPEVASFSGRWRDIDPSLSPDGRRLFFASNRPLKEGEPLRQDFDIWVVEREGGGWSAPRHVPEVSTEASETNTSVTADGALYVARMPTGGKRALYRHAWKDGRFGPGEKLPAPVNDPVHGAGNHYISPDERYLLFSSESRPGSLGKYDLWVSFREDGGWSAPRNLGAAVNRGDVLTPVVVPARGVLVYASRVPFQTEPRAKPYTTEEFEARLRSPDNGQGNLYEVTLSAVGLPTDSAAAR